MQGNGKEIGGDSLEMPEKEMSYSLIGQSLLQEKTDQGIVEILFIF